MPPSTRRVVHVVSGGRSAPRPESRGAPRADLATRLRGRVKALRLRTGSRDALVEALREANASRDPAKVADWIVRQVQGWFPAPVVAVVAHGAHATPAVMAESGLQPSLHPSLWSAAHWVLRHGVELLSGDLAEDARGGPGASGAVIALPLVARQKTMGAVVCLDPVVSRSAPALPPALLAALRVLLEPSAIALDGALALQKAEALSVNDHLTGLYNQRFLTSALRRETKRAARSGSPLSVLFLDLDGFKQVNDTHGHLAGSQVLREAAVLIKDSARETDLVARFGGDEFVLVLPETDAAGAVSVAERIRDRMRETRFLRAEDLRIHQTVSIGVATLDPEKHRTAEALLQAADMAMYRVKAAGKNGVHLALEGV